MSHARAEAAKSIKSAVEPGRTVGRRIHNEQ
jgi:hypothetical protein